MEQNQTKQDGNQESTLESKSFQQESRKVAPKLLSAFPNAKPFKNTNGRKRWKDEKNGYIYEWDNMHGKVERYSINTRKHLGEFDPKSGVQTKNPDPSRKIEI